jgi:hypothetical protein
MDLDARLFYVRARGKVDDGTTELPAAINRALAFFRVPLIGNYYVEQAAMAVYRIEGCNR